jgi:hypothetical protein
MIKERQWLMLLFREFPLPYILSSQTVEPNSLSCSKSVGIDFDEEIYSAFNMKSMAPGAFELLCKLQGKFKLLMSC